MTDFFFFYHRFCQVYRDIFIDMMRNLHSTSRYSLQRYPLTDISSIKFRIRENENKTKQNTFEIWSVKWRSHTSIWPQILHWPMDNSSKVFWCYRHRYSGFNMLSPETRILDGNKSVGNKQFKQIDSKILPFSFFLGKIILNSIIWLSVSAIIVLSCKWPNFLFNW